MSRYVGLSNPKIFHNGRDKFGNGIYHIPSDLPTDDVVEQKKGKWIKMSDADGIYYCCSECGEELYRMWTFDRDYDLFPRKSSIDKTNFCPHCGADMRERKEE